MLTVGWKSGPAACVTTGYVSVTRSQILHRRAVAGLSFTSWRLRQWQWPRTPGAVRVCSGMDLRAMEAWTVSLWTSEQALREFLRSPEHRAVVRPFVRHISVDHVGWRSEDLQRDDMWRYAIDRFRATPESELDGPATRRRPLSDAATASGIAP